MTTQPRAVPGRDDVKSTRNPLDRLRRLWDPSGGLLSVFVTVPPDPAALREFPARLDRLLATARLAERDDGAGRQLRAARAEVRQTGVIHARDWFGRSIAIVASGDGVVLEEIRLPCAVPDRVVLGRRPYLRLLVRAFQQCRPYSVVVLDRRQAWLFEVTGNTVHRARRLEDEGTRAHSYAGWYGLEEYRTRHHRTELARRHYEATVAALDEHGPARRRPVVVGGHEDGVAEFLATLSPRLRGRVAGTFTVDPHTMTPNAVRARAATVMAKREATRHQRVAANLAEWEATGLAMSGVERSAEMVGRSLADLLVVRGDEPVPGWVCDQCGTLTTRPDRCRSCDAPAYPVPDVIDEMVARMLDTGAKVDLGSDEHVSAGVDVRLHHSALAEAADQLDRS